MACVLEAEKLTDLQDKNILDLGCGYGALSYLLLAKHSKVAATEIDQDKLTYAKMKLRHFADFYPLLVEDSFLPYEDESFDMIFMFDVIEHVGDPEFTLKECYRTLKDGGYLYVEFTPYYSVTGHHLYDYAKWPIHILPEEKIKQIIFSKKINGYMSPEYHWKQFKSLNKLRIGQFQKMVAKYEKIREKFIIKYPELFEINIPLFNCLGPLKDYFTMSFEGLYRKRNTG